jgi:hypothetical protein
MDAGTRTTTGERGIMNESYELDDPDREIMDKVRRAMQSERNGDPIKDAISDDEIAEALALLVHIVDGDEVKK